MISFIVYGDPATAGSKAPFIYKGKDGKVRAGMAPASKKTKPWMQQVSQTAISEYDGPVLTGAVWYNLKFYFHRPKSHYGTGRNASKIKSSSPEHHTKKPDLVKLVRAVEDALTGIIWKDDSQVVMGVIGKYYTEEKSRVEIEINEVNNSERLF